MVKMGMGKNYRLQLVRRNLEFPVFFVSLAPSALKGPAVYQIDPAVNLKHVLGSRNFFRRSQRVD
jgi:hypothetical protein